MVSPTVNVVRYSALFTGVFYGVLHKRTLQAAHDTEKQNHAVHERQHLIKEAKEAFKRKQNPKDSGIITDPEDPKFDLEKLVASWETESK